MRERKYFGTDGIRGRVGEGLMQADFVLNLGRAAGRVLCPDGGTVVVGKDTRLSGYLFEAALEAGFASAGVDVVLLGPLPTPAIAHLTQALRADAGVVISASHNPFHDNGLKFFSSEGAKLDDTVEEAIEAELERGFKTVASERLGRARRLDDAVGRYIEFCKSTFDETLDLRGLHLVLDCANGATYKAAPKVFTELGAKVHAIGVDPDGLNINQDVGSTHPEALQKAVVERGADLGIAFDGDGDRVMMVSRDGRLLDGDDLLYILALDYHRRGVLNGPVVGTVMTNLGFERALGNQNIPFTRSKVGDRHVLAMLQDGNGVLGGESSGHILCLDCTTTGDGIVAALQVLQASIRNGQEVGTICTGVTKMPQVMINVRTNGRFDAGDPRIQEEVAGVEAQLGVRGRVLLRPSGTEPVVRVMVEGEDATEVGACCKRLAETVQAVCAGTPAQV